MNRMRKHVHKLINDEVLIVWKLLLVEKLWYENEARVFVDYIRDFHLCCFAALLLLAFYWLTAITTLLPMIQLSMLKRVIILLFGLKTFLLWGSLLFAYDLLFWLFCSILHRIINHGLYSTWYFVTTSFMIYKYIMKHISNNCLNYNPIYVVVTEYSYHAPSCTQFEPRYVLRNAT